MRQRQRAHGAQHAGMKLPRALSASERVVGVKARPLRPGIGVLRLNVVNPHAVNNTKILLAQTGVERAAARRRQMQTLLPDRLGGLLCADQVAADQQVSGLSGKALAQATRLLMTDSVERHIDLALKAQLTVPVGFAMTDQDEFGHCTFKVQCRRRPLPSRLHWP